MIGIYKFTNKITGESYIGQSQDIERRFKQHKNYCNKLSTNRENTYFHRMLYYYGFENFNFEILEECSMEELDEKEIHYIKKYHSLYPKGYNKSKGGYLSHTMAFDSFDKVDEVFGLLKEGKLTNVEIAKKYNVSSRLICDINNGRVWHRESINYPIRNGISVLAQKRTLYPKLCCKKCSQTISKKSKQGLCSNCYNEKRSEHIPDKNTLHNLLFSNSFIEVGKMYGVSDNAVRKWCDKYNIPRHASYYRNVV